MRIYRMKRYARCHRVAVVSLLSALAGLSLIAVILAIGLFMISGKNTELEPARSRESIANRELADNVDQLTVANAMIENRARAFNLAQVAGLAVDGQMQARAELPREVVPAGQPSGFLQIFAGLYFRNFHYINKENHHDDD